MLMNKYVGTFKKRRKSCVTVQKENTEHPEVNWSDYLKKHLAVSQPICMSCYLKCCHCSSSLPFNLILLERVWTCSHSITEYPKLEGTHKDH